MEHQRHEPKTSKKGTKSGTPQIGAETHYRYGKSASSGRNNMAPTRATNK